jgi:hypothetical protein
MLRHETQIYRDIDSGKLCSMLMRHQYNIEIETVVNTFNAHLSK